ncbi:MAG: Uncharacterized protein YczJ, partial [uncultured Rubrobacteraceae bacterium]
DPGGRPTGRPAREDGRVREGLRRSFEDHMLRAGLPLPRATALYRDPGAVRPPRPLEDARRPHRGFPRLRRIRGMEAAAPPLLRPVPHRGAFRAGRI